LHKSSPVSVVAHAPMNPRTSSEVSDDFFMIPSFDKRCFAPCHSNGTGEQKLYLNILLVHLAH
jgi:hypothetical protein